MRQNAKAITNEYGGIFPNEEVVIQQHSYVFNEDAEPHPLPAPHPSPAPCPPSARLIFLAIIFHRLSE